jgi:peptide methionine sulfoxide reductase MsrB
MPVALPAGICFLIRLQNFHSETEWQCFDRAIKNAVEVHTGTSLGMIRTAK